MMFLGAAVLPNTRVPTVEIAAGVQMPLLNFGVQKEHGDAIKLGARGLDTALVYGDKQQSEVGRAVKASGIAREEFFITTKAPCCPGTAFGGHALPISCLFEKNTTKDVEKDLKLLQVDYVDLLLLHWPCDDMADTIRHYKALEPFVVSGKAKALGISNFNASAIAALMPHVTVKPVINQCGYSIAGHSEATALWGRDDETKSACTAHGITYSAYSPLGGWAKGGTGHVLSDPTVKAVAAAHNRSAAQVALKWVVQQGVVAVTSSDKQDHVAGDLAIFDGEFELTSEEMTQLSKVQR